VDLNSEQDNNKRLKILVILDQSKNSFRAAPKKEFLETAAIHLTQKYSTQHVKEILRRAVETMEHFPSIAQMETLAQELGFSAETSWKYFEEESCFNCGGRGWHYVLRSDGGMGVVACDDCRAGKNLQRSPKGNIKHTLAQTPNCTFLCKGNENPNRALKLLEGRT